jgi:gluconolactonase
MAIDADDGLAVAHPDMGAVWIFNHRGEPLYRIDSPGSDVVTNCAYGVLDPHTLYIVDSEGGSILSAELPTPGRKMYSQA